MSLFPFLRIICLCSLLTKQDVEKGKKDMKNGVEKKGRSKRYKKNMHLFIIVPNLVDFILIKSISLATL